MIYVPLIMIKNAPRNNLIDGISLKKKYPKKETNINPEYSNGLTILTSANLAAWDKKKCPRVNN